MAGIGDIVQVTITSNTRTPTRAGFGTPLLMTYHTEWADRVRVYQELEDLVSDGFDTFSPTYLMAQSLLSQNPRPERFKVGRLLNAHDHTQELTVLSAVEGEVIRVSVMDPTSGTVTEVEYTILAAATTTTVATDVAALINAIAGVDASSALAVITVTPTTPRHVVLLPDIVKQAQEDTTADAGYDDDLGTLRLVDDDWYFVLLDVNSEANVDLVSAWTETQTKIFVAQTSDTGEKDATGTLLTGLEALSYDRTGTLFVEAIEEYGNAAWVGRVAPKDPGSVTWKFKELTGVTPSSLTPTQETNLGGNKGNYYTTIGGLGVTIEGVAASGEFLDIVHGTDWLVARIQERVFGILANADKVAYEDPEVDSLVGEIFSVLESAVGPPRKFLRAGTLSVTAPKVADVAVEDRAARLLPDIRFGAEYAGAIHKARIAGTLSV
jgi:hypothetical protein